MSTESTQTPEQQPATSQPKGIDDPSLTFAEYQQLRRGEALPASEPHPSAHAGSKESSEQKTTAQESDTSGKEEVESKEEGQDTSDDHTKEGEDSEEAADAKPKKKSGIQKRVDKLNARVTAAQQEAEYWKQEALKSAQAPKTDPKVDHKPAAADGKPKPEDFENHAEWVEAVADWKAEQKLIERDRKAEQLRLQGEQAKLAKTYSERAKAFSAKTADYEDVMEEVSDIPASPTLTHLLLSSENGPEIAYELAKNRAEFERINRLEPFAAAMEIGSIRYRLASKASESSKTETKKITQAPKPIEPVSGAQSKVAKSLDDPNLSFADYVKLRREQMKRRGA